MACLLSTVHLSPSKRTKRSARAVTSSLSIPGGARGPSMSSTRDILAQGRAPLVEPASYQRRQQSAAIATVTTAWLSGERRTPCRPYIRLLGYSCNAHGDVGFSDVGGRCLAAFLRYYRDLNPFMFVDGSHVSHTPSSIPYAIYPYCRLFQCCSHFLASPRE